MLMSGDVYKIDEVISITVAVTRFLKNENVVLLDHFKFMENLTP